MWRGKCVGAGEVGGRCVGGRREVYGGRRGTCRREVCGREICGKEVCGR